MRPSVACVHTLAHIQIQKYYMRTQHTPTQMDTHINTTRFTHKYTHIHTHTHTHTHTHAHR
jgi:hypothetical protein